jgi:hypothetical protein
MPAFDPAAFDLGFDVGSVGSGVLIGYDPFDSLMNMVCSVLSNLPSATDSYGQRQLRHEDFTSLADDVPCRMSEKALGRPHELKVGEKFSEAYRTVFMRPPSLSDGSELTPHHWLLLNGSIDPLSGTITPLAVEDQIYLNIFEVGNPSLLNHHLEIIVQRLIP